MILRRLGVFFYLYFTSFFAHFLNDGLKILSTRFCPSFNSNLGVTPKFNVSPEVVKHLGNKVGVKASILFHNSIRVLFLKVGLND